MNHATRSVEEVLSAIQALDLDCIKLKLMDKEEGMGWSRDHADRIELEYRRFLSLMVKFPDETIAPTKDVDKFWHGHILDTMKYAEDCERAFGYFLHHFPYFGMRGEQDAKNLDAAAERMHALYEREFGERLGNGAAFCGAAKAFCGATAEKAFCGASVEAAFCGAAIEKAFCGAAVEKAFCGAAVEKAFCGAAVEKAFCGAAHPKQDRMNVKVRPTLPGVA